ncbi:MAG: hypothetical protein O7C75_04530 [Verrucomicrobia bacterium]|nr:hypothetical protein [Verrucomicrobiota bacterium]
MKKFLSLLLCIFILQSASAVDVIQFRSIDFENKIVELHNFSDSSVGLDGWRFCTHDESLSRRYSGQSGMNGMIIAARASLYIYWDDDAPEGDSARINRSSIGNGSVLASPLDQDAYGMQIYFGAGFANGNNIADHIQWSIGGVDNESADGRSLEAEEGGVWTDQSLWISTTENSTQIVLTDITGARSHSPDNYQVFEPVSLPFSEFLITDVLFDTNGTLDLTWEDLSSFGVTSYTVETSPDLAVWTGAGNSGTNSISLFDVTNISAFFRVIVE